MVAKAEHRAGKLFLRVGSTVTNWTLPSRAMEQFYNKRGAAEVAAATIKGSKQTVTTPRLSCHCFSSNEVRLWLSVIAYNLENLWRPAGETCAVLLAALGGESSDEVVVYGDGSVD